MHNVPLLLSQYLGISPALENEKNSVNSPFGQQQRQCVNAASSVLSNGYLPPLLQSLADADENGLKPTQRVNVDAQGFYPDDKPANVSL